MKFVPLSGAAVKCPAVDTYVPVAEGNVCQSGAVVKCPAVEEDIGTVLEEDIGTVLCPVVCYFLFPFSIKIRSIIPFETPVNLLS